MTTITAQPELLESPPPAIHSQTFKAWSKPPAPPRKKLTMEEATELAEGRLFELIEGRVVFKMSDAKHADTQSLLCARLENYFFNHPIGRVRTEFEHRLWPENPHEGRLPDLSVILNESLEREERYATRAPDLAIEIVSYDDRWTMLHEKAELYLAKGSRVVWLVDPYRKGVMIITAAGQRWENERLTCPELLPGLSLSMVEIFTWPENSDTMLDPK